MATHDYVIDNSTGANVRADINSVLQAILTNNSSSSSPSTTAAYMFWADTTSGTLKIRNSSDNAWVELLQLDGTLTLEDGSASTPGLAFRDDLNTGIFSSAADTFNVATAGVERMELGATTIFNEDGADVDFRIEGDTEANLFYVDASTDRIGIGTSSPSGKLDIVTGANGGNVLIDAESSSGYHAKIVNDSGDLTLGARNASADTKLTTQRTLIFNSGSSETERMRILSDGKVGIGTTSPSELLQVAGTLECNNIKFLTANKFETSANVLEGKGTNGARLRSALSAAGTPSFSSSDDTDSGMFLPGSNVLGLSTGGSERMRIESDGDIGLATSTPNASGFAGPTVSIGKSANPYSVLELQGNQTSDGAFAVIAGYNSGGSARVAQLVFSRNGANNTGIMIVEVATGGTLAEVARFTNTASEDRLIIGGSDETNTSGEASWSGLKLIGARPYIVFDEDDRSGEARHGFVAHTTGALFVAKMAGRIAFSASDSGAPTEIINMQAGNVGLRIGPGGTTSTFDQMRQHSGSGREGVIQRLDGSNVLTTSNQHIVRLNRCTTDGDIVQFIQDGTAEGTISVSGGTVSYNGGHLSRWSQLKGISSTDKSARPTIYQGTVMSNLDDLCAWTHADVLYEEDILYTSADTIPEGKEIGDIKHAKGDVLRAGYTEENQQLNMTKVSDVEGDKDVAGVFWAWDDDDDEIVNDFYVAMTGDMVIRVAASTTVARGDLLISAGDGTAKPQADDIVRSSTIAKIISTNHTATYADGSKAYPCVLMAC